MKSIFIIPAFLMMLFNTTLSKAALPVREGAAELIGEARKRAAAEGRLLFADFNAVWCSPCQWMDKNTYSNQTVTDMLDQNYIRVKIDIDQVEGFKLKKDYDIKYLPTILIFNSDGKLVDRIEETLSPLKMTEILTKHNTLINKTIIRHDLNSAPSLIYSDKFISESMHKMSDDYKKHFLVKQTSKMFRVQVGVFSSYQKAEQMVKTLTDLTDDPISVVSEYTDGIPIFKVRLGQFDTPEEAGDYKTKLLAEHNLIGIVN